MARDQVDMTPIETRDELVAWFAAGAKPREQFRVGTEHEKFAFTLARHEPVPYEGPRSIRALLEGMQLLLGWEPIMEGPNIIGLSDVTGGGAISLEPGGQFELSGAPVATIHRTCSELMAHLAQLREVAEPLGIGFLGIGMTPNWSRSDIPVMPKGRYRIMTAYMPKVGKLGLDMMYRTCTVQANLDFSSEADMVKKLRVSLALQPVATAIFANSPFTEGKPNGFLSFRSEIWRDTDPDRSGMLPWAFEPGMGFERWVDYALDVPMYFVKHGERYVDVASLAAAWDLVKDWTAEERQKFRDDVPKLGFKATIRGTTALHLARTTLRRAEKGLQRRQRLDANDRDETRYLRPIQEYVTRDITPAEELLEKFHGPWGGSVEPVFEDYAY